MAELPNAIHERVQALCKQGDTLAKKRLYPAALEQYWAAWDLLPQPPTDWQAAAWILAAIGDVNFLGGDFLAGGGNLSLAMHCPGAIGNSFLHLRLGKSRPSGRRVGSRLHGGRCRHFRRSGQVFHVPEIPAPTASGWVVTHQRRRPVGADAKHLVHFPVMMSSTQALSHSTFVFHY